MEPSSGRGNRTSARRVRPRRCRSSGREPAADTPTPTLSPRRGLYSPAVYDAIVIGARCAGAATAMLLARRGLAVLLVDRARFPSEIPYGHLIHRHGPVRLDEWGLLDRVLATGCPAITSITL